jgi:hypothetical protein
LARPVRILGECEACGHIWCSEHKQHEAGGERISDTTDNRCPCGGGIPLCQLPGGNIEKEKGERNSDEQCFAWAGDACRITKYSSHKKEDKRNAETRIITDWVSMAV